jgi:2-polyprenyl-6-methoxyphenol hydroxylase-like FAD-dependent oxidoreductase
MKQRGEAHDVTVFERDPAGLTDGWGVVFWDQLLDSFDRSDQQIARAIRAQAFRWTDQVIHVGDRPPVQQRGHGFSIGRQRLLDLFTKRARDLGVTIHYGREVQDLAQLPACDVVVVADGANSRLRQQRRDQFQTQVRESRNHYLWLGTRKVFEAFTFPFVATAAGWIWLHAYGFTSDASTCIVECSPETWTGLGFDRLGTDEGIATLERIFQRHLEGQPLLRNGRDPARAPWRNFRVVTNARWVHENIVLLGDAAHTTHFSIGSGTRLAIEDAIELAAQLQACTNVPLVLAAYSQARQLALRRPQREASASARWFEHLPRYISLDAPRFAALLKARRSPLLAQLPPVVSYRLVQAAKAATRPPLLRQLVRSKRW